MTVARLTQAVEEQLYTASSVSAYLTQIILEQLVVTSTYSAAGSAATMTAQLVFIVSGQSGVANVILAPGTVLSGAWVVSDGTSAYDYVWSFTGNTNEAGFSATDAGSAVTRTYQFGGGNTYGTRHISAVVSDASGTSVTSAVLVHVGAAVVPQLHDGNIRQESTRYGRTWPL